MATRYEILRTTLVQQDGPNQPTMGESYASLEAKIEANKAYFRNKLGLSDTSGAAISALSGLTPEANKLPYFTGAATAGLTGLSLLGRTLMAAGTVGIAQAALQLRPGADVQAFNINLNRLAALTGDGIAHRTATGWELVASVPSISSWNELQDKPTTVDALGIADVVSASSLAAVAFSGHAPDVGFSSGAGLTSTNVASALDELAAMIAGGGGGGGGGGTWGSITGTLSAQTDLASALSGKQPLDSDLTAIAALTTTSFGRSVLTQADAAAVRTLIGAGTSSFDGLFASLSSLPTTLSGYGITDAQPLDADLTSIAALTTTGFGRSFLTLVDAAAARTLIGAGTSSFTGNFSDLSGIPTTLAGYGITDGQPLDADLTAIAALTTTGFGRGFLTLADAAAARTLIGAGTSSFSGAFSALSGIPTTLSGYGITDAQPLDSDLTAIAALTTTAFGRSFLTQVDAAAGRTLIGAGTSSFSGAFSALSGIPTTLSGYGITDAQPLDADLTAIAALTTTSYGRSFLALADAAAARTLTGAAVSGAATASGLTMATARLLGRTTASTGAIEELSVGTSLSLSAGSLNTIQGIRTTDTPTFGGFSQVSGTVCFGDTNVVQPFWGFGGTTRYQFANVNPASTQNFTQYIYINTANDLNTFSMLKSRGTTQSSQVALQSGDFIGQFSFGGSDGTNFLRGAAFRSLVSGAVSTNTLPVDLAFFTSTNDAFNEVARFTAKKNLLVGTTSEVHLGVNCLGLGNASTVPSVNPVSGGVIYVTGGALKFRGSSGTVTNLANA